MRLEPTLTSIMQLTVQMTEAQSALITPPPELRLRSPIPEPQNNGDCGEASRSASEAIRQANQSASQSIQQATQQASQSIQQASRDASQAAQQASQSASQAIQQFSNQASQSIAAASRSVSSAIQSADQAIASAKSSADAAVGRANGSMMTAQANASSAQVRLRMEGRNAKFKENVSNVPCDYRQMLLEQFYRLELLLQPQQVRYHMSPSGIKMNIRRMIRNFENSKRS